jgi:hypothetical protein
VRKSRHHLRSATTIASYGRNGQKDVCFSRMLKKSLFSPAQPRCAKTHLSPGSVLASFRSSTGTRPPHHSAARTDVVLLIRRTVRPRGYASALHSLRPCPRNGASWRAGVGRVRSLAFLSILLDCSPGVPHSTNCRSLIGQNSFSASCMRQVRLRCTRLVVKNTGFSWRNHLAFRGE